LAFCVTRTFGSGAASFREMDRDFRIMDAVGVDGWAKLQAHRLYEELEHKQVMKMWERIRSISPNESYWEGDQMVSGESRRQQIKGEIDAMHRKSRERIEEIMALRKADK
jgi:hypothetical protein